MGASKRFLSVVFVVALGVLITLGEARGQTRGEEVTKLPTKKVGDLLTIEVQTSARESWELERLDTQSARVYQRDQSKEEEKLKDWRTKNKVVPGGRYPQFFCFKAVQPGEATIVLRWREVNTGKEKTFRYKGTVERAGSR